MSGADLLFSTYDWDRVIDAHRAALRARGHELTAQDMKDADLAAMAPAFAAAFPLAIPEVAPWKMTVRQGAASGDPGRDFALLRAAVEEERVLQARLPFRGDPTLFHARPLEPPPGAPPPGRVGDGFVEISIAGSDLTREAVAAHVRTWAKTVMAWLDAQTASVGTYHDDMVRLAGTVLRRRVQELADDAELWRGLDMLRRHAG